MNNYAMAAAAQEAYWDEVYEQSQLEEEEVEADIKDRTAKSIMDTLSMMWNAEIDFDEGEFGVLLEEMRRRAHDG